MLPMWAKITAAIAALGVFVVGKVYFKLADTSVVEEVAEKVIKEETGVDIVEVEKELSDLDQKTSM